MRIALLDFSTLDWPPRFEGNVERLLCGLISGCSGHELEVIVCRRSVIEYPESVSVFRPRDIDALRRYVASFDAVVVTDPISPAPLPCFPRRNHQWSTERLLVEIDDGRRPFFILGRNTLQRHTLIRSEAERTSSDDVYIGHCHLIPKMRPITRADHAVMVGGLTTAAVDAAGEICRRRKIRLFLIGRMEAERLPGCATYLGEIPEREKIEALRKAAFAIRTAPSIGSPSLLEPAACGIPTIAVDEGSAVSEYLPDGVCGRTVATLREAHDCIDELSVFDSINLRRYVDDLFSPVALFGRFIDALRNF